MTDDESGMTAVLGEAIEKAMEDDSIETMERFASVLAAALAEAGYGHVGQARAEAWDAGASEGLRFTPRLGYWLNNPYRADREAAAREGGA